MAQWTTLSRSKLEEEIISKYLLLGFFLCVCVCVCGFCVGGSSDGDPDGREASGWAKDSEL